MKERIISALVAIPLFSAIILFAPQSVCLACWYLCVIVCSYEFFKIRGLSKTKSLVASVIVGSIGPVVFYITKHPFDYALNNAWKITLATTGIITVLSWCVIVPVFFNKYNKNQELKINNVLLFSMWTCIISCFFLFAALFSDHNDHKLGNLSLYLLSILITIWANDAGAYFVGKAIGKHKFLPTIIPNKTWEGFFGGMVIVTIILPLMYSDISLAIFAPIIVVFATIGDLFQSMLKRMAGVKDSGNVIPGYGGVFDCIDSWLPVGSMIFAVFAFAFASA